MPFLLPRAPPPCPPWTMDAASRPSGLCRALPWVRGRPLRHPRALAVCVGVHGCNRIAGHVCDALFNAPMLPDNTNHRCGSLGNRTAGRVTCSAQAQHAHHVNAIGQMHKSHAPSGAPQNPSVRSVSRQSGQGHFAQGGGALLSPPHPPTPRFVGEGQKGVCTM